MQTVQSAGNDRLSAGRPHRGPFAHSRDAQNGRLSGRNGRVAAAVLSSQSVRFRVKRIGLHPLGCSQMAREGERRGQLRPPWQPFVGNGVASLHTASLCQEEAHPGRPQAVACATSELPVPAAALPRI
jgi:hypothetical protein